MHDKADNVAALERLANRINRKKEMSMYDIHVVNDAIDELNQLRRDGARYVEKVNCPHSTYGEKE